MLPKMPGKRLCVKNTDAFALILELPPQEVAPPMEYRLLGQAKAKSMPKPAYF
jgi:hypothetical protein